jgi:hypothetical protein
MRCFNHQTLLKERARVTGIEIDLLNLRFLLSRRRLRAQASKGCVMREKRFHSSCHVPKSHARSEKKKISAHISAIQISFLFCRVWCDTITMRTRDSPARHKAN